MMIARGSGLELQSEIVQLLLTNYAKAEHDDGMCTRIVSQHRFCRDQISPRAQIHIF